MPNCPHCRHELTPHEIGFLNAAVGRIRNNTAHRFWGAKLTGEDVNLIRKSKEPIRELAEKYNVSFATIWRVKNNITHKSQNELNCPRCGHELTPKEIGRLFATLGGSTSSPRKAKTAAENGRTMAKLTEKDVANIRTSNASPKELATKYNVYYKTIELIRRNKRRNPVRVS